MLLGKKLVLGVALGVGMGLGTFAVRYFRSRRSSQGFNPALSPCVVLTDCEPDDELALAILRARGFDCRAIVVGEGSVHAKLSRAKLYVKQLYGSDDVPAVVAGISSKKLFPGEVRYDTEGEPEFEVDKMLDAIDAAGPNPTVICLKPPSELLAALSQRPGRAREVFGRATLAAYGSFNFRSLGYSKTMPLVQSNTTPFKTVYYYESHGNNVPNLNPSTAVNLKTWMVRKWKGYASTLRSVCEAWDTYMLDDCVKTCQEEELAGNKGSSKWCRNDKARTQLLANKGFQFVPADPVLALVLFNDDFPASPAAVVLSGHDTDYPKTFILNTASPGPDAEEANATKTFSWKGLDGSAVIKDLDRLLM